MPFVRGFVHVAMHRSLVARLACNLGETLRRRGRATAHRMHASPRRVRAQSMRVRDEEDGELSLAGSSTRRAGTEAGRQGRGEERLAATPTKRIRRCGATGQAPAPRLFSERSFLFGPPDRPVIQISPDRPGYLSLFFRTPSLLALSRIPLSSPPFHSSVAPSPRHVHVRRRPRCLLQR